MTIDQAYRFVNFVSNKEQRGNIKPADFNLLAPICQLELIANLLGNEEKLTERAVPLYGYKSNRKIDTILLPLVTGPVGVNSDSMGEFVYPSGFIWVDSVYTPSNTVTMRIIDQDEYQHVKKSTIHPPSASYPIVIFRQPKGYCEPNGTGFQMTYVKMPTDPYWAYVVMSGEPVYTGSGSVDFAVHAIGHLRICMKILQAVGINLDAIQIMQYAKLKEDSGV